VHLGYVYSLKGDERKATEAYDRALKELTPMPPYLQQLAQAYLEHKLYDRALAVYDRGRKANESYPFYYERAEIFKARGDLTAMISEYLDALEFRESDLPTVQAQLQNNLGYDDRDGGMKNPVLKQELQKRIVKNPGKVVLVEFLIFIQKQQRDFEGAFVQSRALDKRLKEEGQRIYELAKICADNQQWATARRCYEYLLEKGPNSVYYDIATIEALNVEYLSLTQNPQPSREELAALEQKLIIAYQKYRSLTLSHLLLKNLVNIQAYYLGKSEQAIGLLEEFVSQAGLEPNVRAEFKLLLGDLYLVHGAIWDASLLYSQVEKDFKYETIGQEAKFRNAKLSYYAGDFTWAKTQCDVLKGATSKLIANDALDLSLVITDAIGVDTNSAPLRMFASAELLFIQHRYEDAISRMDSINLQFSTHTLGDDIYFKKAMIYLALGKFADAESMYKSILEYYPLELYGDDAQFKLAQLYELNLNDKEKAAHAYEDVLLKYPGSIYTVEARKRFRMLRGDSLNN
jgi:tetratricopeptide (TPR) repeat protein